MKNRLAAVLVLLVIALVAAIVMISNHDSGQLPTEASVRLAWLPGATFVGDYIAIEDGLWAKNGLDVTINPGGFEHDAIKLVAAGSDTYGVASGPQILQARASGVPVVAIGAVIPRSPIGWVTKKDSGIAKPQQFVGQKVGAQFGTHTEITFEALCSKLGIDLEKIDRVPVKFDPRPFVAGEIAVLPVYMIDQPIDLSSQGLELYIIDPGDYGVSLAFGNLYFTTEKQIKEHPDEVRAFLSAARKGWQAAYSDRDKAVQTLAKAIPDADLKILKAKTDATFNFIMKGQSEYLGVFPMSELDWKETLKILRDFGDLEGKVTISECFTNEFLQ